MVGAGGATNADGGDSMFDSVVMEGGGHGGDYGNGNSPSLYVGSGGGGGYGGCQQYC